MCDLTKSVGYGGLASLVLSVILAGCGGGDRSVTDPLTPMPVAGMPTSLVIVSGEGQTVEQHARLGAGLVVRVLDGANNPVSGVPVTFANVWTSGSLSTPFDGTASPGRGNDTATLSMNYFHLPGTQTVSATVAGLAAVTFRVTVAPSIHLHDGLYQCLGEVALDQQQMTIESGTARLGSATGAVETASGAIMLLRGSGSARTRYSGQILVTATGRATLAGSAQDLTFDQPVGAARAWSCARY